MLGSSSSEGLFFLSALLPLLDVPKGLRFFLLVSTSSSSPSPAEAKPYTQHHHHHHHNTRDNSKGEKKTSEPNQSKESKETTASCMCAWVCTSGCMCMCKWVWVSEWVSDCFRKWICEWMYEYANKWMCESCECVCVVFVSGRYQDPFSHETCSFNLFLYLHLSLILLLRPT